MRMVSKIGMARPATLQSRCAVFHTADLATSKTPCRCGRPVPAPGPVVTAESSRTCRTRKVFRFRLSSNGILDRTLAVYEASERIGTFSVQKHVRNSPAPFLSPSNTNAHTRACTNPHAHANGHAHGHRMGARSRVGSHPKRVLPLQFRDRMRTHRQHCRYRRLR